MSWFSAIGSIFSILDKIVDKIPLQGRKEWLQNKIDKLETERNDILIHKADVSKAKRLAYVNSQLNFMRSRLQNLNSK